jgi:ankyrin repeat protein
VEYPRIVALLLENGANPNAASCRYLKNPLVCAARAGSIESVRLLLQFGADPEERHALLEGAGHPDIIALLLEHGANPNWSRAGCCDNALVWAAKARSGESLRVMFAHGGDASRTDDHGGNVLHYALVDTNEDCCQELLAHGADPLVRGGIWDETPMHAVARSVHPGHRERVKIPDLLLGAGASLLAEDRNGLTPGQLARKSQRTSKEVLEWFVQHEHV